MASVLYFAIAIAGLGALSFFTDTAIISVPGLGQGPGAWGMFVGLVVFAATFWQIARPVRPAYPSAAIPALATPLAHLLVVWFVVLAGGSGLITATAVAGDLVRGGVSVVLLAAAGLSAWGGLALRRTRAQPPQWRWEREEPED